jgi:hypothetical protein
MGVSDRKAKDAEAERAAAQYRLTNTGTKASGGTKHLARTNAARMERAGAMSKDDKLALKLKVISLLRELGREPFTSIDRILNFPPGESRKTYEKHNEAYKAWTKKHASEALHRFYKNQITVLELLSKSSPEAVQYWSQKLSSDTSTEANKEKAATAILNWTKLFLATKDSAALRELIPKALLEVHEQAEAMGGHLQKMLGSAVDVDRLEDEPS